MTEEGGYIKDEESGAVINTNETEYQRFKASRALIKKNKNLATRVDSMESDIKDIKDMLLSIKERF